MRLTLLALFSLLTTISCQKSPKYDTIIKNGMVYDGNGKAPFMADIGIKNDTIAFIGDLSSETASLETIDAKGLAVAPGFVNMLSWATESLIHDGRSMSDIMQGITLEVMGEGDSMGPLTDSMRIYAEKSQGDIKYKIEWKTLGGYLDYLQKRGVSTNVASFVGASTVRAMELGYANRKPNAEELQRMKKHVETAMQEGAMGLASALIYTPGTYAETPELIELSKVVAQYEGMYISHLRSEGNQLEKAVDELIGIAKAANIHAEIYHLKAGGKTNWHKIDKVIAKIDSARKAGLNITTDMYNYVAGATGLDAAMPPWVQEGGFDQWRKRLQSPAARQKVAKEMSTPQGNWENLCLAAGPDKTLLIGFKTDSLRKYIGKTLAEVAAVKKKTWQEAAMELVVSDGSRVDVVYFLMSEENVKKQIKLPYMSFCSDAGSMAPEGVFLKASQHPRAYGNFARLLGKYVRDEKVISLEEAIRKLTSLPCDNLKIKKRGRLEVGNYADVVIFDPMKIQDKATFEKPHQLSDGMMHVFVNGTQVVKNGQHTNKKPGRFVKGPGWKEKV
ncbi:amidohydrolase family protein [Lacihabitans sp. CS3-21]|uniref:N-acyl-D-amino-acid deacylase family protein n=1 Tax=Lacihabitans sp. CS3-21 TaxID=2487332 RepID=UPI0020CD89FF|nr:D-aminoacylase [Lacihabitans sp. CS3-21]MCP9747753.1 D-aminoacylase [Lacihabitans sp. CS3-21]